MNDTMPVLMIELANAHGGVEQVIDAMIEAAIAVEYPDKVIKFQPFKFDLIAIPDFEYYSVYRDLYFSPSEWGRMILKTASNCKVCLDILDLYSCEILRSNCEQISFIKFQSSILENYEVLTALRSIDLSDKKILVNVSGLSLDRIDATLEELGSFGAQIILQVGFQSYPTHPEDLGLQKIERLAARFPEYELGIADHSDANSAFAQIAPLLAVAKGAKYVEKHICISRTSAKFDGSAALEPQEMQNLAEHLKLVHASSQAQFVPRSERTYLDSTIQVPVAARMVSAGSLLSDVDLLYRRTAQSGLKRHELFELQRRRYILAEPVDTFNVVAAENFRSAKVAAIIAARMKSTRLKRKALLEIGGTASSVRCLRQCAAARGVQQTILATSDIEEDGVLENVAREAGVDFWKGDKDDVIDRYLGACKHYDIDVVVRMTADNVFASPEIIDFLLDSHFATGADYTAAADFVVGTASEIINREALQRVADHFGRAEHSEYMTWYFQNNKDRFKVNIVDLPKDWVGDFRLTLDYEEDREMMDELAHRLGKKERVYALDDVLSVLRSDPALAGKNAHIGLRYKEDKNLIDMLDHQTRMK
ncbi:cytidylyltransferase domain-containing protein [Sphingomicrobium lutaoense]|uniref:N,N'-diacetyllegionaminate synthase n=1 Tax=Sphingomicrobium lutaoense TaxID=515949 RepID=A0A839Z1D2_9SPHN|nr:N-acetylneuraminate synthase family protein [Sphingomicrobium lutaoense]MBB3763513.1 N,N'-diacetyllegionaminate synthase [Sphingomicrobium lutaoense]